MRAGSNTEADFSASAGEAANMLNMTADRAPRMKGVYFMQMFLEEIFGRRIKPLFLRMSLSQSRFPLLGDMLQEAARQFCFADH